MNKFKAFIKVVKSIQGDNIYRENAFGFMDYIREPLILANDKDEVKNFLLNKYPQFFQNNKIYEKSTKDEAQFFYVVIYPLYKHEEELIKEGSWTCSFCNQVHENKYVSRPFTNTKITGDNVYFCKSDDNHCFNSYIKSNNNNNGIELSDDMAFVKHDSPIYIYKCTEKSTLKSYIGKTKNAPFFRWWNHLQHSISPFGVYLRKTKLSDWTFEVLEELPYNTKQEDVFRIETEYMVKHDSIQNGFNSVSSSKYVINEDKNQLNLF